MKFYIYTIRDVKTGFMTPTIDQNDNSATRNFAFACKNTESMFFTFPDDYALYCVGQYESDTGEIIPELPRVICQATDFARKENLNEV